MAGSSNSLLDDIVGAFRSVGRTLLAVVAAVLVLVVGLFLVGVVAVLTLFFWLGYKLRLTKIPPRARFQRIQARLMSKVLERKLRKSGLFPPGGAAGGPDLADLFQGQFGGAAPGAGSATRARASHMHAEVHTPEGDVEVDEEVVEVDAEATEVDPEELEQFHGSIEEYLRRKRG